MRKQFREWATKIGYTERTLDKYCGRLGNFKNNLVNFDVEISVPDDAFKINDSNVIEEIATKLVYSKEILKKLNDSGEILASLKLYLKFLIEIQEGEYADYNALSEEEVQDIKNGRRDNQKEKINALNKYDRKCIMSLIEIKEHQTFLNKKGLYYIEGHHFIERRHQKKEIFQYRNLDVECNIVPLCPNCHRLVHHGDNDTRKLYVDKIHNYLREVDPDYRKKFGDITLEILYLFYQIDN